MPPGKYIPIKERVIKKDSESYNEDYYPPLDDPNFLEHLITRKEFWKLRTTREPTSMEEKCKRDKPFRKLPHQEFLENYINVATPYNGILVFQGVGSGKTGAAILIAMGFQDVLRRLHKGNRRMEKKKILVLTPGDKVRDNFMKEIFNFDKYFRTKKGLKPSEVLALEGESQQITGMKYMPEPNKARTSTKEQIVKSVRKRINNDFEFMNHQAFANRVITLIGKNDEGELWDMNPDSLDETQRKRINKRYRNRVIIIDEIHNIRDNENNIVPPVLEALVQNAENLRIVLMSATPMVDSPREIVYLINLLLMNDRRPPLVINEIFDRSGNLTESGSKKLKEAVIGYVSYLRSETPDRFPLRLVPDGSQLVQPKYDWKGKELNPDDEMKYQRIFPVEMSKTQYSQYEDAWNEYMNKSNSNNNESMTNEEKNEKEEVDMMEEMVQEAKNAKEETIETKLYEPMMPKVVENGEGRKYMPFIYLSNIYLPCRDGTFAKNQREGYGRSDKGKGPFQEVVNQDSQGRKYTQYKLRGKWAYDGDVPFIDMSVLPKYSSKMAGIYERVRDCRGIALISSQWLPFGVYPMGLILEQNGIRRFLDPDQPDRQLLDTKNMRGGPREPICAYCGEIRKGKKHVPIDKAPYIDEETFPGDIEHVFKEARYALVTGDTDFTRIQEVLMSPGNRWGGEIKIIVGSDAIAEGVNTNYIRQVHMMEPRFNWSTMEQIVGRATRNCSHVLLPSKDRNVDIYYWASVAPKGVSKKAQETELVNVRYYRKAELKDVRIKRVEYIMKVSAVDCFLNKNANLFLPKDLETWLGFKDGKIKIQDSLGLTKTITIGDTPYSRVCDYRDSCDYKCVWEPSNVSRVKVNPATYTIMHAQSDIDRVKRQIRRMYQGHQRDFYSLDEIVSYLGEKEAPEIIYRAIEDLVGTDREGKPKVYLSDPYHRRGHLIYSGRHYVWQPEDVPNRTIPIRARWEPLKEKPIHFALGNVNTSNLVEQKVNKKAEAKENEFLNASGLITEAIERGENIRLKWRDDIEESDYMYGALVGMVLDRLPRADDHFKLLSDLLIRLQEAGEEFWGDLWMPAMVAYYGWNWTNDVGPDKQAPKGFFWDGTGYIYKNNEVVPVDENNREFDKLFQSWNKHVGKMRPIAAQSMEDASRSGGKVWRDVEIMNKVFGMMEFFKDKEWIFKIVDLLKEKGTQTLMQQKSKRSESRGKKCENFKLPELKILIENAKLPIPTNVITGKGSCELVEYYFRLFDIMRKDKKRWFITAIEIFIMNPKA